SPNLSLLAEFKLAGPTRLASRPCTITLGSNFFSTGLFISGSSIFGTGSFSSSGISSTVLRATIPGATTAGTKSANEEDHKGNECDPGSWKIMKLREINLVIRGDHSN